MPLTKPSGQKRVEFHHLPLHFAGTVMSFFRALTLISKQSSKSIQSLLSQSSTLPSASKFTSNQLILNHHSIRLFRDGRPKGSLWRSKKLMGKEALYVVLGLKRFQDDEESLDKFIKNHVVRLLKADMVTVLTELERQQELSLAAKMFMVIKKEHWYQPDLYLYKDLIIPLARNQKMEEAMKLLESMRKEGLFPDPRIYTEVIRGFLRYGSHADAMKVYEDMKKCPYPPEELPFRVLLKGLLPFPLLRNRVKQDFEEIFPDRHVYDPPEEIFRRC